MRLTVANPVEATEVEVRQNPWIEDVTEEHLLAHKEFRVRTRDQAEVTNDIERESC